VTRTRRPRPRQVVAVLAGFVALAVIIAVVGLPLYAFPRTEPGRKTDVIMVIGPPDPSRIRIAERMIGRGLSDRLVVSVPKSGFLSAVEQRVCTERQAFPVTCFTPDPFTTQGEARELGRLAKQNGWTSASVITYTPHIFRSRIIMQRCFSGELDMVADRSPIGIRGWVYAYLYQTGALVKVALHQSC
jgi:hypothetical protein